MCVLMMGGGSFRRKWRFNRWASGRCSQLQSGHVHLAFYPQKLHCAYVLLPVGLKPVLPTPRPRAPLLQGRCCAPGTTSPRRDAATGRRGRSSRSCSGPGAAAVQEVRRRADAGRARSSGRGPGHRCGPAHRRRPHPGVPHARGGARAESSRWRRGDPVGLGRRSPHGHRAASPASVEAFVKPSGSSRGRPPWGPLGRGGIRRTGTSGGAGRVSAGGLRGGTRVFRAYEGGWSRAGSPSAASVPRAADDGRGRDRGGTGSCPAFGEGVRLRGPARSPRRHRPGGRRRQG